MKPELVSVRNFRVIPSLVPADLAESWIEQGQ